MPKSKVSFTVQDANGKTFAHRLTAAIGKESVSALARRAGVSQSALQGYLRGGAEPTRPILVALAKATGVWVEWLASGRGPMRWDQEGIVTFEMPFDPGQSVVQQQKPPEGMVAIPRLEFVASAGGGAVVVGERAVDLVWFNEAWLRRQTRYNINDLAIIEVTGESMEPTLRSGELLLVDHSEGGRRAGDGVFVIRLEGDLLVKRLQRLPGQIKVSADNPAYDAFIVPLNDGMDFAILGRVVLAVGMRSI